MLDAKYKYQVNGRTPVDLYLCEIAQKVLHEMFSNQVMLKKMIGSTNNQFPIYQEAHHSLYLKNAIGAYVGLSHKLQFDPYTQTLYRDLVDKNQIDLQTIFYRNFDMDAFVKELIRDFSVNQDMYAPLNMFLNLKGEINPEEHWLLGEDDVTVILKEETAQKIWITLGIFVEAIPNMVQELASGCIKAP